MPQPVVTVEDMINLLDDAPPESEVVSCQVIIRHPSGMVQTFNLGRPPAAPPT